MRTKLSTIDLSTAVVGQNFIIDWSAIQTVAGLRQYTLGVSDHLTVYNESGCGLAINLNNSGRSFTLPAGAWIPGGIPLSVSGTADTRLVATVLYVLSGAGVSQLHSDYFNLGEPVVSVSQVLGNSPVNIGGGTVPAIIFSTFNLPITALGTSTLFIGSVVQGAYRIGGTLFFNSTPAINTHPTLVVNYTDPDAGSIGPAMRTYAGVLLDSSETLVAGTAYQLALMEVPVASGVANLQISYSQSVTAGVNDHITLTIEKVG